MNKKKLFIFGISLFLIFSVMNFAQAFIAPSVYVDEFNLNSPNTSFAEGDTLSGNFIIWNSEDYLISDIVYKFNLIKDESSSMEKIIIDEKIFNETLVLYPGGKLNIPFDYSLPANIMSGVYKFRVKLITKKGIPLGWEDIPINIQSSDNFLYIKEAKILKNNSEEHPAAGIGFDKNETVEIKFTGENPSANSIAAQCQIIIYERMANMLEVFNIKKETIIFASGERKNIQYKMPFLKKPESYLAEIKFYNDQNEVISNALYFRWVVQGASAEILSIKTDESSYLEGEKAEVQIDFVGAADTMTSIGDGKMQVKIYNEKNEIVGEASRNLNIDENASVVFQIPIRKDTDQPRVEAAIIKGGAVLDNYEINVNPVRDFSVKKKKSNLPFYFLLILVLALISFFIYKRKNRNKPLWILFFAFIIFGSFFSNINFSQAAKEVYSQACHPSYIGITWNNPIKEQTFAPGDAITFSGEVYVPACMDALLNNTIRFYITTDPPPPGPIIRNECVESEESKNIRESILTAEKTIELGKIVDPGQAVLGPVEYEATFTFPFGFEGKVYAMVYFDGYHWGRETNHYRIIAKEEIYVNTNPIAQIECDPGSCEAYQGKGLTLLNESISSGIITESVWEIKKGGQNFGENTCGYKCDYTLQNPPIGDYTAHLTVTDEYGSDSAAKPFRIKKDIEASFQCSLDENDPKTWSACSLIEPITNQTVYFKDTSTLSQDATGMDVRDWTFPDGDPNEDKGNNNIYPSTKFLSKDDKNITLNVRDNAGRADSADATIGIKIPMPKWREVHPKTD